MAKTMTKTKVAAEEVEVVEEPVVKAAKKEKHKFVDDEPIRCVSITPGQLGMIGAKTGINYNWAGRGDETEVEYQDLAAAVRLNKKHITQPYFVIQNEDFIAQFPAVAKVYENLYTIRDLKDVFKMSPSQMKATILGLPEGAKNSLKNIASTEISNGRLDSIQKIKILDEIFDTKFMLMTELYS